MPGLKCNTSLTLSVKKQTSKKQHSFFIILSDSSRCHEQESLENLQTFEMFSAYTCFEEGPIICPG